MRWKFPDIFPNYHNKAWHKFFAWYPVQLEDNSWIWLETVERRYDGETIDYCDVWVYRAV